jgi:hypothetical protein
MVWGTALLHHPLHIVGAGGKANIDVNQGSVDDSTGNPGTITQRKYFPLNFMGLRKYSY